MKSIKEVHMKLEVEDMRKGKERTTVNFDADVYQKVLEFRAKPEYARMSISAIVNMLLERVLTREEEQRREA